MVPLNDLESFIEHSTAQRPLIGPCSDFMLQLKGTSLNALSLTAAQSWVV